MLRRYFLERPKILERSFVNLEGCNSSKDYIFETHTRILLREHVENRSRCIQCRHAQKAHDRFWLPPEVALP